MRLKNDPAGRKKKVQRTLDIGQGFCERREDRKEEIRFGAKKAGGFEKEETKMGTTYYE